MRSNFPTSARIAIAFRIPIELLPSNVTRWHSLQSLIYFFENLLLFLKSKIKNLIFVQAHPKQNNSTLTLIRSFLHCFQHVIKVCHSLIFHLFLFIYLHFFFQFVLFIYFYKCKQQTTFLYEYT